MHAMLPKTPRALFLDKMKEGEWGYILDDDLRIDSKRRCWLNVNAVVKPISPRFNALRVERKMDGSYHVWALPGCAWEPEEIGIDFKIPVAGIRLTI